MRLREKKLKKKGWTDEEIARTKEILLRAQETQHPKTIALGKTVFWVMLLIIITGTILGAWIIEPVLLVTTEKQASIAIALAGILFGCLATILFRDIENIELHHRVISFFIIPISAIITATIIGYQTIRLAQELSLSVTHNPFLLGSIYAGCALLPYIIFITIQRNTHATY